VIKVFKTTAGNGDPGAMIRFMTIQNFKKSSRILLPSGCGGMSISMGQESGWIAKETKDLALAIFWRKGPKKQIWQTANNDKPVLEFSSMFEILAKMY